MNSQTETARLVERLSHRWHAEHKQLNEFFDEFRRWAYQVTQQGDPRFGETGVWLAKLRQRLSEHFKREDELVMQFAVAGSRLPPEVEANKRHVEDDHSVLLDELDQLITKLKQLDPPFTSWVQAIDEVEMFIDRLNRHEEQEADSLGCLLPKKG